MRRRSRSSPPARRNAAKNWAGSRTSGSKRPASCSCPAEKPRLPFATITVSPPRQAWHTTPLQKNRPGRRVLRLHAPVEPGVGGNQAEHHEELRVQPALAQDGGLVEDQEDSARDDERSTTMDERAEQASLDGLEPLAGGRLGEQARDDEQASHPQHDAEKVEEADELVAQAAPRSARPPQAKPRAARLT